MSVTCVAFNLRRANRLVTQAFDDALRPSGLKITQFSLLTAAYLQKNQNLNKLARVMGMDRTTLSRNLRLMEKNGLVDLEKGQDKREVRVCVTQLGLDKFRRAAPLWYRVQTFFTKGLGEEKWEAMLKDLRAIGALLKK
jgi:DNA-binding MarR family transcriptional regulator